MMFIFDPPYLRRDAGKVDYWGIGMLVVGIGALQYVLDKGQEADWFADRGILTLSIVSAVTLLTLIYHEWTTEHPIIDLRVLKERSYATGVFLMTMLGFVLYGSMVLLPIMLQTLLGYPSMQAGIAMAPRGMGSLIMMPILGFLTSKIHVGKLLAGSFFLAGLTFVLLRSPHPDAGHSGILLVPGLPGA